MATGGSRRVRAARKRQKRMARVEHDLAPAQWAALVEAWGGCAYCGATDRPLQKDCVQPISRGGRYTLDNVVPACASCNASKSNDEVTGWLRRKRLDERAFLVRHHAVRASFVVPPDPDPDPDPGASDGGPDPARDPDLQPDGVPQPAATGWRGEQPHDRLGP